MLVLYVVIGVAAALIVLRAGMRFAVAGTRSQRSLPTRTSGPAGMVGETAVVTRPVGDLHAGGMIHGRGEEWPAYTEKTTPIEEGAKVLLLDFIRGKFLVVDTGDELLP